MGNMVYKRNGIWHYGVKVDGAWVRKTSRSRFKRDAERMQAADNERAAKGMPLDGGRNATAPVQKGTAGTLEGLLAAFLSSKEKSGYSAGRWRDCTAHITRHLGNPPAHTVKAETIENYIEARREERAAPATIQTELRCLRAAYNWGMRTSKKLVAENPTKGITVKGGTAPRNRRITRAEIDRLLLHLEGTTIKEQVEISLHTALRLGELQKIQERHCDFHAETIWVPESKTGKPRAIPMHPRVKEILWDRVQGIDQRKLFASPRNVGRPFRRALKRAGLSNIRWHDLRRAAASLLFESGADTRTVMQVGGWTDSRVPLEIYAQVSPEHVREAVHRLPTFGNGTAKATKEREREPVKA